MLVVIWELKDILETKEELCEVCNHPLWRHHWDGTIGRPKRCHQLLKDDSGVYTESCTCKLLGPGQNG